MNNTHSTTLIPPMMDPLDAEALAPSKFQEAMRKLLKHIPEEHLVHFHPTKVNQFSSNLPESFASNISSCGQNSLQRLHNRAFSRWEVS